MKRKDFATFGGAITALVCVLVAITCGLYVDYMLGRADGVVGFPSYMVFIFVVVGVVVLFVPTWTLAKEFFNN